MADTPYYSINEFAGNGVQTTFEISFAGGYISRDHVQAYVKPLGGIGAAVNLEWIGPNTVRIVPAPAVNTIAVIYRSTPKNAPLADFSNGAVLSEASLDINAKQAVFIAAEAADAAVYGLIVEGVKGDQGPPGPAGDPGVKWMTPEQKGALGDDVTNDGPAFQAAIDDASNRVALSNKSYRLLPMNTPLYRFRNQGGVNAFAAEILASNKTFTGPGTVRVAMRTNPAGSEIHYGFVSPLNVARGSITDLMFLNMTFDTNNADVGTANTNQRGIYLTGAARVTQMGLTFRSTGARRGGANYIDNSDGVLQVGMRLDTISAGNNQKYSNDYVTSGFVSTNVNETFDDDGTARGRVITAGAFKGDTTRGQQPLDINGQRDGVYSNLTLNSEGGITVSYKITTPPDFATFLQYVSRENNHTQALEDRILVGNNAYICVQPGITASTSAAFTAAIQAARSSGIVDGTVIWDYVPNPFAYTPAQRIIIANLALSEIGRAGSNSLVIGNEWNAANNLHHESARPVFDIIINNWLANDATPIIIQEGDRIKLSNGSQTNVSSPAAVAAAAIDAFSGIATGPAYEWSGLSLSIRDWTIDGCDIPALRIRYPEHVVIENLVTRNCNKLNTALSDLQLTNLEPRGGFVSVDGADVSGNVTISGTSTAVGARVASTQVYKGQVRTNGGSSYKAEVSGITDSGSGPSGTGSAITDGTVVWKYLEKAFRVVWGRKNRVGGTMTIGGDAHRYIEGMTQTVSIGDIAATGDVLNKTLLVAGSRRILVTRVTYLVNSDVAASSANFRTLRIRTQKGTPRTTPTSPLITTQTNVTGFTAYTPRDATIANLGSLGLLEVGEALTFDTVSTGTGVAINGLTVLVDYIEL